MILPTRPLSRALFAPDPAPKLWRVGWWILPAGCLWSASLLVADLPPGLYVPALIFAVLLGVLLFPALLAGLVLGARRAWIERTWLSTAPLMPWSLMALLVAGTLGTVGGDLPERIAFRASLPELERLLAEAEALPREVQHLSDGPRRMGLYLADEIRKSPGGRVRFVLLGTRLLGRQHGLIWVPAESELPMGSGYEIEPHGPLDDAGGGWYRFVTEL